MEEKKLFDVPTAVADDDKTISNDDEDTTISLSIYPEHLLVGTSLLKKLLDIPEFLRYYDPVIFATRENLLHQRGIRTESIIEILRRNPLLFTKAFTDEMVQELLTASDIRALKTKHLDSIYDVMSERLANTDPIWPEKTTDYVFSDFPLFSRIMDSFPVYPDFKPAELINAQFHMIAAFVSGASILLKSFFTGTLLKSLNYEQLISFVMFSRNNDEKTLSDYDVMQLKQMLLKAKKAPISFPANFMYMLLYHTLDSAAYNNLVSEGFTYFVEKYEPHGSVRSVCTKWLKSVYSYADTIIDDHWKEFTEAYIKVSSEYISLIRNIAKHFTHYTTEINYDSFGNGYHLWLNDLVPVNLLPSSMDQRTELTEAELRDLISRISEIHSLDLSSEESRQRTVKNVFIPWFIGKLSAEDNAMQISSFLSYHLKCTDGQSQLSDLFDQLADKSKLLQRCRYRYAPLLMQALYIDHSVLRSIFAKHANENTSVYSDVYELNSFIFTPVQDMSLPVMDEQSALFLKRLTASPAYQKIEIVPETLKTAFSLLRNYRLREEDNLIFGETAVRQLIMNTVEDLEKFEDLIDEDTRSYLETQ